MSAIAENLAKVLVSLPEEVTLVAVSKFHPAESVAEAYTAGQRVFGESRAAELSAKAEILPGDIEWHFIGHLQSNKVKPVVAVASMIQSVDSERLLRRIDDEATRQERHIDVLLQVHVAQEETKFGFAPDEMMAFVSSGGVAGLRSVTVRGIMGMATNTDDDARVAADFATLRKLFDTLKKGAMAGNPRFDILSMGMSHDRNLAIAAGSTMVRVGTDIFGQRVY